MDTAAVVLFVLVCLILDRALTSLAINGSVPWLWQLNNITECDTNLASSAELLDRYCCTRQSIATQCAAYTQHHLGGPSSIVPTTAVVCWLLFVLLECVARRTFGWRYVRTKSYDADVRRHLLRNVRYRVLASIDLFVSLMWHSFLIWWAIAAVLLGWHVLWVALAMLTVVLSLATTLLILCVSRRLQPKAVVFSILIGVCHWCLSLTALIIASIGLGKALLPKPDLRFATVLGAVTLILRAILLACTVVYVKLARAHLVRTETRREQRRQAGTLLELPGHLASILSETETRAIRHMAAGTHLLLSTRGQRPKPAFLQLSTRGEVLRWSWRGHVLVHEIQSIHASRHPDYRTPCITLIMNTYGVAEGQRALDLILLDPADYRFWMTGLQAMVRSVHQLRHGFSPELVAFVLACFRAADSSSSGLLSDKDLCDCFTRLNVAKTREWARSAIQRASERAHATCSSARSSKAGPGMLKRQATQLFKGAAIPTTSSVNAQQVFDLYAEELCQDTIVRDLFRQYAKDRTPSGESIMTKASYVSFLRHEQGMGNADESDLETCWKHAYKHIHRLGGPDKHLEGLTETTFRTVLLSANNDAFDPHVRSLINEDMSLPLSHYYINSSHNSYLEGNQLTSKASVEMYKRHLLMGCRCVELDCFDGSDGQPCIRHGNTLVQPISLRDVIRAVMEVGFVTSPYPITLSLEMHCSPEQQVVLVAILEEELGDHLAWPDLYHGQPPKALPSPEDLRGKVLVKAKKRRIAPHEVLGEHAHDDAHEQRTATAGVRSRARQSCLGRLFLGSDGTQSSAGSLQQRALQASPQGRSSGFKLNSERASQDLEADDECEEGGHSPSSTTNPGARGPNLASQHAADIKQIWIPPKSGMPWAERLMDVTYLPSVKFKEPMSADHGRSPYEISSISEARIKGLYKDPDSRLAMVVHNSKLLTRIYPDGVRQDSSNMDPTAAWTMGCHMVCLNYQTWDLPMRLNFAKFLLNGSCGYVRKPLSVQAIQTSSSGTPPLVSDVSFGGESVKGLADISEASTCSDAGDGRVATSPMDERKVGNRGKLARMRGDDFDDEHLNAEHTLWRLRLIHARQLPKAGEQCCIPEVYDRYCPASRFVERVPSNKSASISSPMVEVSVHGGGAFRSVVGTGEAYALGATYTSKAVIANGATPCWDEYIDCVVEQPDDAILALHVYDRASLIAYQAIPMSALRPGWRVLKLRSPTGSRLVLGSLLVHLTKETRKGVPANMKKRHGLRGMRGVAAASVAPAPRSPLKSTYKAKPGEGDQQLYANHSLDA